MGARTSIRAGAPTPYFHKWQRFTRAVEAQFGMPDSGYCSPRKLFISFR